MVGTAPSRRPVLFPLSDDDRALAGPAWATWLFVALNVLVFVYQLSDPAVTYGWSVVPQEITTGQDLVNDRPTGAEDPAARVETARDIPQRPGPGPAPWVYLTVLSAMFMHGGWAHLGGNLLYLWIFGDNVEHRFGTARFVVFYLASGVAATLVQVALDPDGLVPNLGASGAIAGVLGAYLVLFPRNKVNVVFIFRVVAVPGRRRARLVDRVPVRQPVGRDGGQRGDGRRGLRGPHRRVRRRRLHRAGGPAGGRGGAAEPAEPRGRSRPGQPPDVVTADAAARRARPLHGTRLDISAV